MWCVSGCRIGRDVPGRELFTNPMRSQDREWIYALAGGGKGGQAGAEGQPRTNERPGHKKTCIYLDTHGPLFVAPTKPSLLSARAERPSASTEPAPATSPSRVRRLLHMEEGDAARLFAPLPLPFALPSNEPKPAVNTSSGSALHTAFSATLGMGDAFSEGL